MNFWLKTAPNLEQYIQVTSKKFKVVLKVSHLYLTKINGHNNFMLINICYK